MSWSAFRVLLAMSAVLVGSASAPINIASADAAPAKIDASFKFVTYDCGNQSPIRIVGQDSTITLNGSCGEVDVSGAANTVNLQTVAVINATGGGNHITWVKGPGGAVPQISNPGHNNDIRGPGGLQVG
ncbi:DUF3060 domain-containing protein [Mycobacterium sp. Aquia_213]|uniref:DUF3060 domain-containing protein n=1 Tax=Mycobacterium sp. Aquia_213 TaxID=2991728 RepID=UPI002270ADA1|nr:DUF3060 domain-containing protein [Mycobacterium sp. Aquia_213]WAC92046.1 DUF3060 domain-containing protein [Mycobacterium sp. Aquia_213]